MEHLTELKQTAMKKGERYQDLLSQGNELSSAEIKEAGELANELREIKAKIDVYKDHEEIKSWLNHPKNPFDLRPTKVEEDDVYVPGSEALKGFTDDQKNAMKSTSYHYAFDEYIRKGRDRMSPTGYKTLQEGADINGGFLVPEQIMVELIQKRQGVTGVMDKVRRVQTGRDSLVVPRSNWTTDNIYTSPIALTKTGEVPASASTALMTDPTFGQTKIDVYTHMVNGSITKDMLEDSLFDVQSFISDKFSEAVRQKTEAMLISGTGAGQPAGILAAPGSTIGNQTQPDVVNSGIDATNRIVPAGLVNLAYALEPQYDGPACFILNKTNTARGLFNITDSEGRFLFANGFQDSGLAGAKPKELLGYEYVYSNQMPNGYSADGASGVLNNYPIIFGDLSGYWMVERAGLSVMVLDQPLATLNQVQLVGRYRFGGAVVEPWKIKILKVAAAS